MSNKTPTGKVRYRVQSRLFRKPIIVLQIEFVYTNVLDYRYDPYDVSPRHLPDVYRWEDATLEHLTEYPHLVRFKEKEPIDIAQPIPCRTASAMKPNFISNNYTLASEKYPPLFIIDGDFSRELFCYRSEDITFGAVDVVDKSVLSDGSDLKRQIISKLYSSISMFKNKELETRIVIYNNNTKNEYMVVTTVHLSEDNESIKKVFYIFSPEFALKNILSYK